MEAGCPKPTAANKGTLISVEDLFWNVPLRKKVAAACSLPASDVGSTLEGRSRCCGSLLPHLFLLTSSVVRQAAFWLRQPTSAV